MKNISFGIQLLIAVGAAIVMTTIEYFLEYFLMNHFMPESKLFASCGFILMKLGINTLIMYGVLSFVRWFLKKRE